MATVRIKYQKQGATFADGYAARADKNQFFPPGLAQSVDDNDALLLLEGVILAPVEYIWDQATFTLTRQVEVTSLVDYQSRQAYDKQSAKQHAEEAGWTFAGYGDVP